MRHVERAPGGRPAGGTATPSDERRAAPLRSMLFAPASHLRHAEKALAGEADAAILDLEDAVALEEKENAREAAASLLRARRLDDGGPLAFVRVNALSTPFAYGDLRAVVGPGCDGIMHPKTESPEQVAILDWLLLQLERERGLAEGSIPLLPIVETAAGLQRVEAIAAASERIRCLNLGAGDFSLDTHMRRAPDAGGLLWARVRVVVASRAAGLEPPIDSVYFDLRDEAGLIADAEQAQAIGFQGKACIHPAQVAPVNRVFAPSGEEVERARRVVAAFEAALASGTAAIQVEGMLVDYPIAEEARRVLRAAARPGGPPEPSGDGGTAHVAVEREGARR